MPLNTVIDFTPSGLLPTGSPTGYQRIVIPKMECCYVTILNQMVPLGTRLFIDSDDSNPMPLSPFQSFFVNPKNRIIIDFASPIVIGAGGISNWFQAPYKIVFSTRPLISAGTPSGNGAADIALLASLRNHSFYQFEVDGVSLGADAVYINPFIGCPAIDVGVQQLDTPSWKSFLIDKVQNGFNRIAALTADSNGVFSVEDSIVLPSSSLYYLQTAYANGAGDTQITIFPSYTPPNEQVFHFRYNEVVTMNTTSSTNHIWPSAMGNSFSASLNQTAGANSYVYEVMYWAGFSPIVALLTIPAGAAAASAKSENITSKEMRTVLAANVAADTTFTIDFHGRIRLF